MSAVKEQTALNQGLVNVRAEAAHYRAVWNHQAGVIVIVGSRSAGWMNAVAVGWMNELRDPQNWEPGCLAVDCDGRVFESIGGNAQDGAREWAEVVA